jgi:hypothetical protein
MLSCILPLIHPEHRSVQNYAKIEQCLLWTLQNLLQHSTSIIVVIVGHRPPAWIHIFEKQVHFIQLDALLFQSIKDLDDGTCTLEDVPPRFLPYLTSSGMFHNKDKGLKYFIGLLYLTLLPKKLQPDFVGIIDADDFIRRDIGKQLDRTPSHMNMFIIQQGYLMMSPTSTSVSHLHITGLYPLRDFSHICGTNRFFRFRPLCDLLWRRLRPDIPPQPLTILKSQRRIGDACIRAILSNIKNKPNAWTVLPKFLGLHRIVESNGVSPPHPFASKFNMWILPGRNAVKFVHDQNHSCEQTGDESHTSLVQRYIEQGHIPRNHPSTESLLTIMNQEFGLRVTYASNKIEPHTIQN